jgi:hypothetical protein
MIVTVGLLGFGTLPRSASEKAAECHAAARVPALECLIVVSMRLSCVTVSDNDGPAMKSASGCPSIKRTQRASACQANSNTATYL